MTEFNPPISKRDTSELLEIICMSDDWSKDAINQAKTELKKRKITDKEQNGFIKGWNENLKEIENQENLILEKERKEGYKPFEAFWLFLFGPIIFMSPWNYNYTSVLGLWNEKKFLKLKQRVFILILSFTSYFVFISNEIRKDDIEREKIRQIEIEKYKQEIENDKLKNLND
jgi:hypothetical protein